MCRTHALRVSLPQEGAGFTLIELVMVLTIIAIVSVVAAPRFFKASNFQVRGYFDEALSAIRYAQKRAVSTGCDVRVQMTTGKIQLHARSDCDSGSFNAAVPHPSRSGDFDTTAPSGVTTTGSLDFYFDPIGRPRTTAGVLWTNSSAVQVGAQTLRVHPQTGFVQATF